jgi:hypothetical protein
LRRRLSARVCGCRGHVGRRWVRCLILRGRHLVLIRVASYGAKHCRQGN